MQQLRAKQLKVVLVIALLTTYVMAETELEVKIRNLRSEMKAFPNTTIAEMDERVTELEAEVVVLQETQLIQTEHIQVLRDEIEDATQIIFTSLDALDDRTDMLENRDKQHDHEIDTLKDVDAGFSSRMTTVEDIVLAPLVSCQSDPCTNVATCIDVTADRFICSCPPGHYGALCENSLRDASFLATFSFETSDLASGVIIFDEVRTNPGNHYNATTGYYTVPQSGTYEIYYQLTALETNPYSILVIDDVDYTLTMDYASDTYHRAAPTYITTHLNEGQVVNVYNGRDGCTTQGQYGTGMRSWFGINLLYAD